MHSHDITLQVIYSSDRGQTALKGPRRRVCSCYIQQLEILPLFSIFLSFHCLWSLKIFHFCIPACRHPYCQATLAIKSNETFETIINTKKNKGYKVFLHVLFGINTLKHDKKKYLCITRHNRYLHYLFVHCQMDVYMVYKPMQHIELFCCTKGQK